MQLACSRQINIQMSSADTRLTACARQRAPTSLPAAWKRPAIPDRAARRAQDPPWLRPRREESAMETVPWKGCWPTKLG